ncbi:uncharacterized protein AB675_5224 [Cyphellophora attinorum]|uniref:NTF2-like domain-containing protein n=1 Tax=Cyphellophora attinorum TaxID=1664694 RepID=A0A0N1H881_9EURO|nr:uncharacterized protein AB675_5224 [Phialophora attinorum]KPI39220.1 hypothetical protein AB675_5224 [Phialophora attinorum]
MLQSTVILAFASIAAAAAATWKDVKCLSDAEASQIASRYIALYDTGAVSQLSDLTSIVTQNFTSYDGTGTGPYDNGPSTVGAQAFYESLTASTGPSSFTDSVQSPVFVIHTCDTVVYRWQFTAVSTGYNATVPAGTKLAFEGTDIVQVDLSSKLIYNATSSGDWINLARELGQIGNYFP